MKNLFKHKNKTLIFYILGLGILVFLILFKLKNSGREISVGTPSSRSVGFNCTEHTDANIIVITVTILALTWRKIVSTK